MEISSSIFLYCATRVCIITDISIITNRGSARPWGFAMHRMMYRTYLDRVSESVFGAQKFEFCPNKGKKSGSRIAYWGSNLSTLFWKFHNVDSERLFQSFSLCKLSESETSMHALGKACGQEWSTVFDFWGENKLIKASTGPPRVNSRHLQALFDGPTKSGERPINRSTWYVSTKKW